MASLVNQIKIAAAQRQFYEMANAFVGELGVHSKAFTLQIGLDGTSVQAFAIDASSRVEKLLGTRQFQQPRAYANTAKAFVYAPKAWSVPSIDFNHDSSEAIGRAIANYFARAANFMEEPVHDALLGNARSIDGVALLSSSHPYGPAGNQSNLASGAASTSTIYSLWIAMSNLQLEGGTPAGIVPDTLLGGAKSMRALESFIQSSRPVPVDSSGGLDTTSSVVAAAAQGNWAQAKFKQALQDPFIVGSGYDASWFMLDTRDPSRSPLIVAGGAEVLSQMVTDPQSEPMVQRSEIGLYMQTEAAIVGSYWYTIGGYIA